MTAAGAAAEAGRRRRNRRPGPLGGPSSRASSPTTLPDTEREHREVIPPMRLELGTPVHCTDELFGALADVVIDPVSKRLTHLVVSIHGRPGPARLVPMEMVSTDPEERLCIGCTVGEAARLEAVQDFAYLRMGDFPVSDPKWDVGVENVLAMPYYPMSDMSGNALAYDDHVSVSFDRVPKG